MPFPGIGRGLEAWPNFLPREGHIRCNLSKASRILSILRMHAHDLDLNPRSPSTNDGPRALVLSYGFQKRAIAILKRLTLVTLFFHVRRAVHLKKERSRLAILRRSRQHGGPARDEKFWKAKSKGHESRRKLRLPMKVAEKRCSVAASMRA